MTQFGKFEYRPPVPLKIENFDPSDIVFLQIALSVANCIVVSGESDFMNLRASLPNDIELKQKLRSIKILTPEEAINDLVNQRAEFQ